MKWAVWFASGCFGAVAAALAAFAAFDEQGLSGLGVHGVIAIVLGALFTAALAAGLMALVFHSGRSGHDEAVHHAGGGDPRHG
jgi:hypothetical protein